MPESASAVARKTGAEAEELEFEGLSGLLGYCVRRAQGAMHRDFVASLSSLDLTQKQAATLWLIGANPGVSQVTVAGSLGMDRATMMSLIDRLEQRGFVLRKRSTSDRRRQELHLTPAGQTTLRKAKTKIAEHERRFTARFKQSELSALLSALRKVAEE